MNVLVIFLLMVLGHADSANILGVFFYPAYSHQSVYRGIYKELHSRGHQVTVITPNPLNDPDLVNLTEISVNFAYDILRDNTSEKIFSKDANVFVKITNIYSLLDYIVEAELKNDKVKKLIEDGSKNYDLILLECFHPALYAFAARFHAPTIAVCSQGALLQTYYAVGNSIHPAAYPDVFLAVDEVTLTLKNRILSSIYNLWYNIFYYNVVLPRNHRMVTKYFGTNIPYLGDLEKNVSAVFVNENPFIHTTRPDVPTIVQINQVHIKPIQPLPEDLKQILDSAQEGVIYFSLGSNVKSVNLDEHLRHTIIDALSQLPYIVLWKWESDHLPGKPDNVFIRKWLPQQDILGHSNVKAFVTQGGLQSIEEAIARAVPLVGIPFIGEQSLNVRKFVDIGIGIGVEPTTVTKQELTEAIIEVAENSKYKKRISEIRDLLNDQPMSGLERAMWWCEYVIKHKGTRHLRSPMADLPWYQYFLLDVVAIVIILPSLLSYLVCQLVTKTMLKGNRQRKVKFKLN